MKCDDALSSVVSEMLLIALVLILIPSVTITLMHQVPGDRVPTVNIKMTFDGNTITLYHKGGDFLIWNEVRVIQNDIMVTPNYSKNIFDLGDSFSISAQKGDAIQIVTKKTVIFSGIII